MIWEEVDRCCRLAHYCHQQIRNVLLGSEELEGMGRARETFWVGGHREGREKSRKVPLPEGNGTISASRRNSGKISVEESVLGLDPECAHQGMRQGRGK